MSPLVSVIIGFLNGGEYIREAIDSVINQTYDNWDLLLVDDGSKDGATNIAKESAASIPERIRYLGHPNHENRGMSATRNLGIKASRGIYVTFLDVDDVFLPDKLEVQVGFLANHLTVAAVFGPNERWYSWRTDYDPSQSEIDTIQNFGYGLDRIIAPPEIVERFLVMPGATPLSIMVRRTVLDAIGGYENSFHGMYEDQVAMSKLFLNYPAYATSRLTCRYRQHENSCVSLAYGTKVRLQARRRFLDWLGDYMRLQELNFPKVSRIRRREAWKARNPNIVLNYGRVTGRLARLLRSSRHR